MGVLSLFRLSNRSSKHQSPPPTLSQITRPSLQLHHNLQCPSAVFKSTDVRLQQFFDAEQLSVSSEQAHFSSTVAKFDFKRKSLRASRSKSRTTIGRRNRKKEPQLQIDFLSTKQAGEIVDSNILRPDSPYYSTSRTQPPANNSSAEWSGSASTSSDKPRIRSKSYTARPIDALNSYRDRRFSLTGLAIPPVIHHRDRLSGKDGSSPPRIPAYYRHFNYFDPDSLWPSRELPIQFNRPAQSLHQSPSANRI